ncbi:MAG: hypothetical protein LBQ52_10980 [Helicobacteraceae bacterium]|nr:hypothetical protein [Helicobacteraceae bacterium]
MTKQPKTRKIKASERLDDVASNGDLALSASTPPPPPPETSTDGEILKTTATLPDWLDKYIYDELGAKFAPDHERYENNLDLNKEEVLIYLGTYFPRSYAEAFCISNSLLENETIKNAMSSKGELNLLSVGCGAGGELIGMLTAIAKHLSNVETINIWAFDGNDKALKIARLLIDKYTDLPINRSKICASIIHREFDSFKESDLNEFKIGKIKFDLIVSSKMIVELIAQGSVKAYYDFVKTFLPLLSPNGICALIDVTIKHEKLNKFNPEIMNNQISKALRELNEFQTILPSLCRENKDNCNICRFVSYKFSVSHSRKNNDQSKIAYRVIARKKLAQESALTLQTEVLTANDCPSIIERDIL